MDEIFFKIRKRAVIKRLTLLATISIGYLTKKLNFDKPFSVFNLSNIEVKFN
jgi:hypothetical protein